MHTIGHLISLGIITMLLDDFTRDTKQPGKAIGMVTGAAIITILGGFW